MCIDGVFSRFFKIIKLEGVRIPKQISCVCLNFNKEQKGIAFSSKINFVPFTNEQFNRLRNNASIWHDPISTLDTGHAFARRIPCLNAFTLWEIKVYALFNQRRIEPRTNGDVVKSPRKVRAITASTHSRNVEFIAIEAVFIAVV